LIEGDFFHLGGIISVISIGKDRGTRAGLDAMLL
jgi:hypothetical protein